MCVSTCAALHFMHSSGLSSTHFLATYLTPSDIQYCFSGLNMLCTWLCAELKTETFYSD